MPFNRWGKLLVSLLFLFVFLFPTLSVETVWAKETPAGDSARGIGASAQLLKKEEKDEAKEERDKAREEKKLSWQEKILAKLSEKFAQLLPAGINRAVIDSISQTTFPAEIVVTHEGKKITLRVTEKTNILRKYSGKATLTELKKGDLVSARGVWQDPSADSDQAGDKAVLETRVLRDLSLEKRQATFWGKITTTGENGFALDTGRRGLVSVLVGPGTKIVDRREREIPLSSLAVGHRVRVTGLWDATAKKLEPVKLVKDWSIAPQSTPSPTVAPTSSPAITPTASPLPTVTPAVGD